MRKLYRLFLLLGAELLALVAGMALLYHPLAMSFALRGNQILHGWIFGWFRFAWPGTLLLFAALALGLDRFCRKTIALPEASSPRHPFPAYLLERAVDILRPWLWLPATCCVAYAGACIGPVPATTAMAILVALLGAFSLEILHSSPAPPAAPFRRAIPWRGMATAAYFLLVALLVPTTIGTAGDESHYRIQRNSLVQEHNLNLNSEFKAILKKTHTNVARPKAVKLRALRSHILQNAKGDYYSYHSFGLPLLSVPFAPLGVWGDILLLAGISCLGLLGCRAAALAAGAPVRASNLLVGLTTVSTFWALNSAVFLPEILGCALVAWAFWAVCAQQRRPWASAIVAILGCAFLPYAHTRFLVLAGMLALAYGLEGLFFFRAESWPQKLARLGTFSIACFAAWGLLAAIQTYMFSSVDKMAGSYDLNDFFLSYPRAMWAMWADRRGLGAFYPLLYWLTPATLLSCFIGPAPVRRRALYATAATALVLLVCCSTSAALGGACFQGRYLMQAVPLLLPFGAILLSRTGRTGRLLAFLLAAPPVLMLIFLAPQIPTCGNLIRLPALIRTEPAFGFLWEPLATFRDAHSALEPVLASLAAGFLLLACAAAFLPSPRWQARLSILCLLLALPASAGVHHLNPPENPSYAHLFATLPYRHYQLAKPPANGTKPDIFKVFGPAKTINWHLTDTFTPALRRSSTIVVSSIAPNDWTPENRRWFSAYRGTFILFDEDARFLIRIRGTVERGEAIAAVSQGKHVYAPELPVPHGPFDISFLFQTHRHHGWITPLLSLKGNTGQLHVRSMDIIPYQAPFADLFAPLPPSTVILQ